MQTESVALLPHSSQSHQTNKTIYVVIIGILLITNTTTILTAIYTNFFNECINNKLTFKSPEIDIDDGNQYNYNTDICKGYRNLWQNPSIPVSERNTIGRAIFQTPEKVQEAISLIKQGKRYDLGRAYSLDMPLPSSRSFATQLFCDIYMDRNRVSCKQGVSSNALGNIGTQFDNLGHAGLIDVNKSNEENYPSNEHLIFFNNFRGTDLLNNHSGIGDYGMQYFGSDKLPMFFTKAILIDIAGYKNMDILEPYYAITNNDMINAMRNQNLKLSDIGQGDVVFIYTGWSEYYETDPELFYDGVATPGLLGEVITDLLFDTNVMIIGSDKAIDIMWNSVTNDTTDTRAAHEIFITCGGGFLHELLDLKEWVYDARNGNSPWIGSYMYQPLPFKGSVASPGKPVVFV
eukprot:262559_1